MAEICHHQETILEDNCTLSIPPDQCSPLFHNLEINVIEITSEISRFI